MTAPTIQLSDGSTLPAVGFGTYPMRGAKGVQAISSAIRCGYRLIDTAVNYENEDAVGEAIRESGVPRDEILVTSKIPGRDHGYDDAVRSTHESLERLGLDHLDVHLIHWPNPSQGKYLEAWRALVDLQAQGLVRTIGVCNFTAEYLDHVADDSGVMPTINQIELHPYFPQVPMREANASRGVQTEAWSPLGKRAAPYREPVIRQLAQRNGVSPAQVVLRWHLQIGSLPIPKASSPEHQRANLDVFGFSLTAEDMASITSLGRTDGRLFGGDPRTHEEM